MKKANLKRALLIFAVLWFFGLTSCLLLQNDLFFDTKPYEEDEPNSSNGELSLVTPENTTYTEPMSGFYPGSYGFEADADGSVPTPTEWNDASMPGSYIEVLSAMEGHNKILHLWDSYEAGKQAGAEHTWSDWGIQTYGTIEFWFMTSDVYSFNQIVLRYGSTTSRLRLVIDDGKWLYHDSKYDVPGLTDEFQPQSNEWYHVRMDFETTTGGYSGLDQYRWRVIINNEYVSGEMWFDSNGVPSRLLYTTGGDLGYSMYIDAIGYSFDPNYNIGDNLKPGLAVKFNAIHDFEDLKYSIDGTTNKTILGNTSILMPLNGLHTIQLFGTHIAVTYSSQLRFFTVNFSFNIVTPEERNYNAPMNGYFPSTYGFEDEKIGAYETNIDFVDLYNDPYLCELYVTGNIDGHRNVLDCFDHSGSSSMEIYHFLDDTRVRGSVEFWWRVNDVTPGVGFALCHDTTYGPRIDIVNDYIRYFDSAAHNIISVSDDTWYHVGIDFECGILGYMGLTADKFNIRINGISYGPYSFDNALSNINRIKIWTGTPAQGIHNYIDAIGYNWETDYKINDNTKESFLLQHSKNFNHNWLKFSLDGNPNKTYDGNYMLPRIDEGHHTIQVFAEKVGGIEQSTGLRRFSYFDGCDLPGYPLNFQANDGINHTYLTWDEPDDNNAPITHYNIYRGDQSVKTIIANTTDTFYNDTETKDYLDQRFYYYVTAVNVVGESEPSEEDWATARDRPNVEWKSPGEWERVIFPPGNTETFEIDFTSVAVDDVELILNDDSYGSVFNTSSVEFVYGWEHEGHNNATLIGYQGSTPVTSHSRNFTFGKAEIEVTDMLDSGTDFIGEVLYLILHDPVGDNSFSGYSKSTSLCTKVKAGFMMQQGFKIGPAPGLGGFFGGASLSMQFKEVWEEGFTYRITNTDQLTSNLERYNKDFIGPGRGDVYWGEAQVLNWEFKAKYREYFNGTKGHEEPILNWGLLRRSEVFLNDYNAPEEWKMQNPVHNGWQNVDWNWNAIGDQTFDGGKKKTYTHESVYTTSRSFTFRINLNPNIKLILGPVKLEIDLKFEWQHFEESQEETKYSISYTLYDDDPTDILSHKVGLDTAFGTHVFKPNDAISRTSNPLEYNSSDYIPPVIQFPVIELDTNLDGLGPCSDDSPKINVAISDEGGIHTAVATYSSDNGVYWHSIHLEELVGNPGIWDGSLPAQTHGTSVLWYIRVWDNEGYNSSRYDQYNNLFSYTVLNRDPVISLSAPLGGETYTQTVPISWQASDSDDDTLTYTLAYNKGGIGWFLIARDISSNTYNWDISQLPYIDSILIKVIADDGYGGTAETICDFVFTIGEPPPSVMEQSTTQNLMFMFINMGMNGAIVAIAAIITIKKVRSG